MNWIQKVRHLKKLKDDRVKAGYKSKYFIDISYEAPQWQPEEIEVLAQSYPWLPQSYVNFIKEFDNLELTFVVFFGSQSSNINPLVEEIEYYHQFLKEEYLPFGKYPDGSIFAIHKNHKIYFFDKYDDECKEPVEVANSFEEFINDYVLGKRYEEYGAAENPFYLFLQDSGWL